LKLQEVPVRFKELQFCAPIVRSSLKFGATRASCKKIAGAPAARSSALLSVPVKPFPAVPSTAAKTATTAKTGCRYFILALPITVTAHIVFKI